MLSFDENKIFNVPPVEMNCPAPRTPQSFPEKVEHTARLLRDSLDRLRMFEQTMKEKYDDLFSIMTQDNVTFKELMQKAYADFVSTVKAEVNLFETNADVLITTYKEAVNAELERFAQEYAQNHEELTAEIAEAVAYMKTAVNENLDTLLHEMETNGEILGVIESDVLTSVKKFGATGDGVTDDTEAIQNALNRCKNVLVPAGTYVLTSTIVINANNYIKCEDGAIFLNCHSGAFFVNGSADDTTTAGYDGNSNIVFDGGVLDYNYPAYSAGRAGLAFGHAMNITVKGVTFLNITGGHAVELGGCKNVLIDGCSFKGFITIDRDYIEAIQIELTHPDGFLEFGLSDFTPCKSVTIQNCYFGAYGTNPPPNVAAGHHGATYAICCHNIVFANNIVNGCTYAGIRPCHWENVRIENNKFYDCARAVMIDGVANAQTALLADTGEPVSCTNVEVGNNDFILCNPAIWMWARQNTDNGKYAEPKHITLKDNRAANCTMFLYGSCANGLHVLNNTIENCTNTSISANDVKNTDIRGNVIIGGDNNAIQIKDITDESGITQGVTVSGNKISNNKYIGVYVRGCNRLIVSENTFVDCGLNTSDYPIYIHNFVKNAVIRGNALSATAAAGKGWGCIFGVKNEAVIVAENVATNYSAVDLNTVVSSEIHTYNNIVK